MDSLFGGLHYISKNLYSGLKPDVLRLQGPLKFVWAAFGRRPAKEQMRRRQADCSSLLCQQRQTIGHRQLLDGDEIRPGIEKTMIGTEIRKQDWRSGIGRETGGRLGPRVEAGWLGRPIWSLFFLLLWPSGGQQETDLISTTQSMYHSVGCNENMEL